MGVAVITKYQNVPKSSAPSYEITTSSSTFTALHSHALFYGYWYLEGWMFPMSVVLKKGENLSKNHIYIPHGSDSSYGTMYISFNSDGRNYSISCHVSSSNIRYTFKYAIGF